MLFLITQNLIYAQNRTLFNIPAVQQSTNINPAIQHNCRLYIGLPLVSSIYFNLNHTAFDYNDVFKPVNNGKYTINIDKLENMVNNWNYVKTQLNINLFAIAYKYKNYYFTFDILNKTDVKIGYPDDYIKLPQGNGNFMGKNNYLQLLPYLSAVNYNEFAFGISRQVSEQLTYGGKIKYLQGMANTQITNSYLKLYTDENTYDIQAKAKVEINSSFPMTVTYDSLNIPSNATINDLNITKDFIFNNNRGLAIDFGMIYKFNKKITISASALDLGFISWKTNTNNYKATGDFTYTGVDISKWWDTKMISGEYEFDSINQIILTEHIDSLQSSYNITPNNTSYYSFLHSKIYFGATYQFKKYLNFGVVTRAEIYNKRIYPSLTLSANTNFWKNKFQATLSYSVMNNTFRNIGFGLALKLGPVQLYTVSDNILLPFNLKKNRSFNFHFGMNLYFGCKNTKKNKTGRRNKRPSICPAYL